MNKVDIYVNDKRLDLFNDEEISINLSVQNVKDISKTFTDFTQSFTIPTTPTNNNILGFYYKSDLDSNVDGRLRQSAQIEINSIPFRSGVIEIEDVQLKGTEPYAYTLTFYGDLVTLSDLFGEDYLYDLDFSAYDIAYTDDNVYDGLTSATFAPLFFALMSPVKNWYYDSNTLDVGASNIAQNGSAAAHGINYYELKPALKVTAILDAIEAQYGITFTGSFLSSVPFTDLSLWLHRFEGYLFGGGNDIAWQLIDFNTLTSGSDFNISTDTWTVAADGTFTVTVAMTNVNVDYEVGLFANGQQIGSYKKSAHPSTTSFGVLSNVVAYEGQTLQLFIRPQNIVNSLTYQCSFYDAVDANSVTRFLVSQSTSATYSFVMVIQDLMPEIKVKDFLAGILKMYNLVLVPSGNTFLLQPLDDWYAAGTPTNYQNEFDITEYAIGRPSLYREIEFKYQETEQILGYQYQRTYGIGYGDLRALFSFDGDEFLVELPFECPLFERLTNENGGALTNVLVYKSITSEIGSDGSFNPYLGAPVLFYGYFDAYSLTGNTVMFVDADGTTKRTVSTAWYANTSNRYSSAAASDAITFGAEIDPYHLASVNSNLYADYWDSYITDLYNKARRIFRIDAVLPLGKMATLKMNDIVIWNNQKYIINNVKLNLTTGKATFELLNVV